MKKVLLFVAVVSAFSFASCKKDRTCTCTTVATFTGGSLTFTQPITIIDSKKGDAKKMCINSTSTNGTDTQTTTCELK